MSQFYRIWPMRVLAKSSQPPAPFGCGFDAVPEGVRVKAGGGACGDKQVFARPAAGLRHLLIRPGFTQVNTCVNYSFPVPAVSPGQGSPSSVQDLIDANWTPRRNGA